MVEPICSIRMPHSHSSFDDPISCVWNAQVTKPEPTSTTIRARYLPKEKRWLVLVDDDNPFVTEHPSLAEAMRLAGAAVESR